MRSEKLRFGLAMGEGRGGLSGRGTFNTRFTTSEVLGRLTGKGVKKKSGAAGPGKTRERPRQEERVN